MSEWENFTRDEFKCRHCSEEGIDDRVIDVCQDLRDDLGFALVISSGYRCGEHPAERRKTATGTHTMGLAADIQVSGGQAVRVLRSVLAHEKITGVGVNQRGPHKTRFVHLDIAPATETVPRPWIWTY